MKNRTKISTSRYVLGALLLMLAATVSSCGMALPTQPAVDSGVATTQRAATTSLAGPDEFQMDDNGLSAGGPDVMNQPPAGETIIPTPGGPSYNGVRTGWWNNLHRHHNK